MPFFHVIIVIGIRFFNARAGQTPYENQAHQSKPQQPEHRRFRKGQAGHLNRTAWSETSEDGSGRCRSVYWYLTIVGWTKPGAIAAERKSLSAVRVPVAENEQPKWSAFKSGNGHAPGETRRPVARKSVGALSNRQKIPLSDCFAVHCPVHVAHLVHSVHELVPAGIKDRVEDAQLDRSSTVWSRFWQKMRENPLFFGFSSFRNSKCSAKFCSTPTFSPCICAHHAQPS